MKPVELLVGGGFKNTGQWLLHEHDFLQLEGDKIPDAGVYAHVIDGDVVYVGKAHIGLRKRMRHYERSRSLATASHVRGLIREALVAGKSALLYTLVPAEHEWNGLPVDLIAGVEAGLIRNLRPKRSATPRAITPPCCTS